MKQFMNKGIAASLIRCLWLAFGINLIIEFFSRRNIADVITFVIRCPIILLYNTLIIFFTLSVVYLTKRRIFAASLISIIWVGLGIVNFILLSFRVTPFSAVDFRLIKYGLTLANTYMSTFQILMLIGLVFFVLMGIFYLWKKAPKSANKISILQALGMIGGLLLVIMGSTQAGLSSKILAKNFGNIAAAYQDYGFAYCFANSLLNTGIEKPKEYSEEAVVEISKEAILPEQTKAAVTGEHNIPLLPETDKEMPNIIFVQLESFFDPTLLNDVSFSKDPIPNFRRLQENYSTGYLNVPSVGAGTANTEFEVISGFNLDFFGPGEYPYKTILQKSVCESISFNLKELDYTAHAIHNNEGTFYDRHMVFSQLGFDTFTPVEYMNGIETNPTGWAKDEILVTEIEKVLQSTPGRDFVYTISVQGHGAYPEEEILENPEITVSGIEEETRKYQLEYYVNQLYEMDQFIGKLVEYLESMEENYILVLYGDHLPSLNITEEEMKNGSLYQTRYVTSNNMGLPKTDRDVEAFQLTSQILNQLGIHIGTMIRFHQNYLMKESPDEETYLKDMQVLEYDMLYGDFEVYGGSIPYTATDLQMGVTQILINRVTRNDNLLIVYGRNFTEYSKVYLNEKAQDTTYLSPNTLLVEYEDISGECSIVVRQVGRDKISLGVTDSYELLIPKAAAAEQ